MSEPNCTAAVRIQPDISQSLQDCQRGRLSPSGELLQEVSFYMVQAVAVKRNPTDYMDLR